jgi:hypothetical protein
MAKQLEFEAYQKYLEALRDYWIIRADMQRSLGGRLPTFMHGKHRLQSNLTKTDRINNQDIRINKIYYPIRGHE